MRYLLNTLVSLTIVLIGFAQAQTARANVIDPMITNFSMDPIVWFVDEEIEGDINLTAVSTADPDFAEGVFASLSNSLPIVIANQEGIMTFTGGDESGYTFWVFNTTFTYTPDTSIGVFVLMVGVAPCVNVGTMNQTCGDATGNSDVAFEILPVPEPSTLALFAFGLAGLGFMTRRRRNRRRQN